MVLLYFQGLQEEISGMIGVETHNNDKYLYTKTT